MTDKKIKQAAKLWANKELTIRQISDIIGENKRWLKSKIKTHRDLFPSRCPNGKAWTKAENDTLLSFCKPDVARADIIAQALQLGLLNRSRTSIDNRLTIINSKKREYNYKARLAIIGCNADGCDQQSTLEKPFGKFCEQHARAGFPRDMGTADLLCHTSQAATNCRKNVITMPKLRVMI